MLSSYGLSIKFNGLFHSLRAIFQPLVTGNDIGASQRIVCPLLGLEIFSFNQIFPFRGAVKKRFQSRDSSGYELLDQGDLTECVKWKITKITK